MENNDISKKIVLIEEHTVIDNLIQKLLLQK